MLVNRTTAMPVELRDRQFSLDGLRATINLDPDQMGDGVYDLTVKASLTGGVDFTLRGDATNKLLVMRGDWNGDSEVNLLDFTTFRYWFGLSFGSPPPLQSGTAPA